MVTATDTQKTIYIVITQTGTVLSRILKFLTRKKYNHASISLDEKFENMYSFGRKNPYNPVLGGFVKESPHFGTFKRFKKTDSIIVSIKIDNETYSRILEEITEMYENKNDYHYNYSGLLAASFGFIIKKKNHFYCSEFVYYILNKHRIITCQSSDKIVKPMDLIDIKNGDIIYRGKLNEFS